MTFVAMVAIKQKEKAQKFAWESVVMIGLYLTGLYTLYAGFFS